MRVNSIDACSLNDVRESYPPCNPDSELIIDLYDLIPIGATGLIT